MFSNRLRQDATLMIVMSANKSALNIFVGGGRKRIANIIVSAEITQVGSSQPGGNNELGGNSSLPSPMGDSPIGVVRWGRGGARLSHDSVVGFG